MIRSDGFPADTTRWVRDIGRIDAIAAARRLDRRPLLVLHGMEDAEVPVEEARALADAGRPTSELRLVHGASHRLRHDPRAIATLLGWLARQVPSGTPTEVPAGG
jgi:putative redox protein